MSNSVLFEFPQGNDLLKHLQAIEFEMAVAIKDIFERNNINYAIAYGSLLGAVRHGGFIPWDDDFDFVVFEEDYDRASEVLRRELPAKYILHDRQSDPGYFYSFSKVRHLQSVAIEEGFTDNLKYNGISIDLFKGRIEKNNKYARKLFLSKSHTGSHWTKFLIKKHPIELCKVMYNGVATCFYAILHCILPKTPYYHISPDTAQYFFPLEKYLPSSKVIFNGLEFYAPNDTDYVLTAIYGNWKSFPTKISFHINQLTIYED
ncbi:MAG: LicD family protein [Bacteroidales bacterium]|nr:LicD family protein [Bacteroidales bacterium]